MKTGHRVGPGLTLMAGLLLAQAAPSRADLSGIHATFVGTDGRDVAVSWHAGGPGQPRVRYGLAPEALSQEQAGISVPAGTGVVQRVCLTGLLPGRVYHYQCVDDGQTGASRLCSFRAASTGGQPVVFAVLGDIQVKGPDARWRRAAAWLAGRQPDFCLSLGDQVDRGLRAESWSALLADGAPLLEHTVFMPLIGNHDCYGEPAGAVQFPELYARLFPLPGNGVAGFEGQWYSFRAGPAAFTMLNAYPFRDGQACDARSVPEQTAWLERTLAGQSEAAWRFVGFHPPVHSSGPHGGDTAWLATLWGAVLERAKVAAVFSGHTHAFEVAGPLAGQPPVGAADGILYYNAAGISYSAPAAGGAFTVARQARERQALVLLVTVTPDKATFTTWDFEAGRIHHETGRTR